MSLPIKVGIGSMGLLAIAIPGTWMAITAEPTSTTLADSTPENEEYKDKFGDEFKHHMVSATNSNNDAWWNWSFKYRWQEDKSEEKGENFKDVTNGASLKGKCLEIYKKENKENLHKEDKIKDEKAAWRYCSLEGQKPVTLKEINSDYEKYDEQSIGKKNEGELISILNTNNNRFWEIHEKAFFKATDGLGSKATEDSIFKTLYKKESRNATDTLRNTCQEAYKKTESSSSADKKYALMFCSLATKSN